MALVGILWAEIGVRLFAKVPPLLVGIVCCTAGSACIALSKYYNGIARLIDSTPERTLKSIIAAVEAGKGTGEGGGLFSVFRAAVSCDHPMLLRSSAYSRIQPAVQWLAGRLALGTAPPGGGVHSPTEPVDLSQGLVSFSQGIERVPETVLASLTAQPLFHDDTVPFRVCGDGACAQVSLEGLDLSHALHLIRDEATIVTPPPGILGIEPDRIGVHITEHALPVGTQVHVVGEVVSVADVGGARTTVVRAVPGALWLGRMYVSRGGVGPIVEDLRGTASRLWWLGAGLITCGACVLAAASAWRRGERRRRTVHQTMIREIMAGRGAASSVGVGGGGGAAGRVLCMKCESSRPDCISVLCHHKVLCEACAGAGGSEPCPLCGSSPPPGGWLKVFEV